MAGELQVKFAWSGRARSLRTGRAASVIEQPSRIYSDAVKPEKSEPQPRDPDALHQRNVRVSDTVWLAAQAKATEQGTTISDVVREALERFAQQ